MIVSQWVAFVCFFVYGSFFEWALHKYLMHQPRWGYPFRAHALVHHGLFRTGARYFLSDAKVIRKVRFAWWNAPMIVTLHVPAIVCIEYFLETRVLFGALAAIIVYYSLYEYLHYCMHIPKGRWLEKTACFRWLDSHHYMHHKSHFRNLNVVLPLADLLFGSLIPTREHVATPDREKGAVQVGAVLSAA